MTNAMVGSPITEAEWELLEDPDWGRYEVIDGVLELNPSANAVHNRITTDLAEILRTAAKAAGANDDTITNDVEWRVLEDDMVRQAPRGDVVMGQRLDPVKAIHQQRPVMVAEVWDSGTRPGVRERRRRYWLRHQVEVYWEVESNVETSQVTIAVYDQAHKTFPRLRAEGDDRLEVTEPIPIALVPNEIFGWAQRQIDRARREQLRADQEQLRADQEQLRADREQDRADRLQRELDRLREG